MRQHAARRVELDHAVALGIARPGRRRPSRPFGASRRARAICERGRGRRRCCRRARARTSPRRRTRAPMMNACARPSGVGCTAYADRQAPARAVAEQPREARHVLGRRDQQDVADAGQHQRRQRVVDHRLVVDRQQLLRHDPRERIQPRAGAAGEDDALGAASAAASRSAAFARGARLLAAGTRRRVLQADPLLVVPGHDARDPGRVVEIPAHRVPRCPTSNVSTGVQPSSRRIFAASIA